MNSAGTGLIGNTIVQVDAAAELIPPISAAQRIATLLTVILPMLSVIVAIYGFWGWGFSWVDLGLLISMYAATGLGVTLGFHRLFTHRSFEAVRPLKLLLAILGSMSVEGSVFHWVAMHRRHHQHSDQADDPHSPHRFGNTFFGVIGGWWHSHVGWLFTPDPPNLERYVGDLKKDAGLVRIDRLFVLWVLLGLAIPAIVGGLLTWSWWGVLLGFLWGGLVRIFVVHHVTWSINSVCHMWGQRPYRSRDESRNNVIFGFLSFGEGWHNNHHAFPTSARHGLHWWQLDITWIVIRVLQVCGLIWRVRVPTPETLAAARNDVKG